MGLFVSEKDNFTVVIKYACNRHGTPFVITEDMEKNIDKNEDEKTKFEEELKTQLKEERGEILPIDDFDYVALKKEDFRKIEIVFRKPNFSDIPVLFNSLIGSQGNIATADVDLLNFNQKRLSLLFIKGTAEDEDGKIVELNIANISELNPSMGYEIVNRMSDAIGTQ